MRRYWSRSGCLLTTLSPVVQTCTKASNKLTQPCCRLCFEALASVLLNQQCQNPLPSNPGPSNSGAWLPTLCLSPCGAFPAWSLQAPACLTASTSLSPVGSSPWMEATQPAAPSQAVQTRGEAWTVVFLGLTLEPSLRPQLSPEMLGNTDPVC